MFKGENTKLATPFDSCDLLSAHITAQGLKQYTVQENDYADVKNLLGKEK